MDLVNRKIGWLTITSFAGRDSYYRRRWNYICDCGTIGQAGEQQLLKSNRRTVKSCGCQRFCQNLTHGMSNKPIYQTWEAMIGRCHQPNHTGFYGYGGRGIKVCDRWRTFYNFFADMGDRPKGMTLERIDGTGNYEPGNCRWATPMEQARNRKTNRIFIYRGTHYILKDLAKLAGITAQGFVRRIKSGMSIEDAVNIPLFQGKKFKKRA